MTYSTDRRVSHAIVALLLFVFAAMPWAAVLDSLEAAVLGINTSAETLPLRRPREFAALASAMDAGPPPRRLA